MRVVLDTNVLLSALISPHGAPDAIYQTMQKGFTTEPTQPLRRQTSCWTRVPIHCTGMVCGRRLRQLPAAALQEAMANRTRPVIGSMDSGWPRRLA